MQEYRIYFKEHSGRIARPSDVVECADDEEAIKKAERSMDGLDVEVWEGPRLIVRLPRHI